MNEVYMPGPGDWGPPDYDESEPEASDVELDGNTVSAEYEWAGDQVEILTIKIGEMVFCASSFSAGTLMSIEGQIERRAE